MSLFKGKHRILCVSEHEIIFLLLSPHILRASLAYLWFGTVGGQILVAAPQQKRGTLSI